MVLSVATEKIFSDTTGNRSRDRPTSSAVPLMLVLLYIYIYIHIHIHSSNISAIMIISRMYENQNLLSLFVSFLVGLRNHQRPCTDSFCSNTRAFVIFVRTC